MEDYGLDRWLGGFEVTPEQRASLHRASDMVAARYPDKDLADDREAALSAAAKLILGDATLAEHRDAWVAARLAERAAMAALTGAIIAAAEHESENAIATQTGINRITVRKALGK